MYEQLARFDGQEAWARLTLGAIKLARELDRLLDRWGRPSDDAPAPTDAERRGVEIVLGLIALRERLGAVLAHAAVEPGAEAAPLSAPAPAPAPAPRELLR